MSQESRRELVLELGPADNILFTKLADAMADAWGAVQAQRRLAEIEAGHPDLVEPVTIKDK